MRLEEEKLELRDTAKVSIEVKHLFLKHSHPLRIKSIHDVHHLVSIKYRGPFNKCHHLGQVAFVLFLCYQSFHESRRIPFSNGG